MTLPVVTLSVDVESWVHGRLGTKAALWPDSAAGFREVYGEAGPGDAFRAEMEATLALLDRIGKPATFFFLVEMARLAPEIVRAVAARGHEVALHGLDHRLNSRLSPEAFRAMVRAARTELEDMAGAPVVGYRAPFLVIDSAQLRVLDEEDFLYDSSVCPSRKVIGKFANMTGAPQVPYRPDPADLRRVGAMRIVELPLPVMPLARLPVGNSIMTRVAGGWWTRLGLAAAMRRGYVLYYFHPYEVADGAGLPRDSAYLRLFYRNVGAPLAAFMERQAAALSGRAEFLLARVLAQRVRDGGIAFGAGRGSGLA